MQKTDELVGKQKHLYEDVRMEDLETEVLKNGI
jgi:hypothetical protein